MKKYEYTLLIKSFRNSKKIKQYELAKKLNISTSYLSKLENNKEPLTLDMLINIGTELNVCPKHLFAVRKIRQNKIIRNTR